MPVSDERREPMQRCHHCGISGQVGSARIFIGGKAGTLFKCHNCQHRWEVPDPESKPPGEPRKQ